MFKKPNENGKKNWDNQKQRKIKLVSNEASAASRSQNIFYLYKRWSFLRTSKTVNERHGEWERDERNTYSYV